MNSQTRIALVTGAARRVGAAIIRQLHAQGFNVIIHYRSSLADAQCLAAELNAQRENSAELICADLMDLAEVDKLISTLKQNYSHLNVLVNNASTFYPTPLGSVTQQQWQELVGSNVTGPFFLSQGLFALLRVCQGCIVNISDIHARMPLKQHTVYCIAKAGLDMLTKSLAKEFAPDVRVNAVAPGAVAWPEEHNALTDAVKQKIIQRTALQRHGSAEDIANAVKFLVADANYVTGETLCVSGGRY